MEDYLWSWLIVTIGKAVTARTQLLTTQSMNIQPSGASEEWVIHNIIVPFGGSCELYATDGTNNIKMMNLSMSINVEFHPTNDHYYTVKNVGSTTIYVGYDGLITQE